MISNIRKGYRIWIRKWTSYQKVIGKEFLLFSSFFSREKGENQE